MKVLVTGGSGIVGRYIVEALLRAGHSVKVLTRKPQEAKSRLEESGEMLEMIEGDVLDVIGLDHALRGVDVVIHAAGKVSFHASDYRELMQVNHLGTTHVVNACLHSGISLLYISSVACLSPGRPMPCEVDERSGFNPDRNTSAYSVSKYLAELEVFRGIEEGLKAAILNPVIVLAPGKEEESSASLIRYAMKPRYFQPSGWLNYTDARDLATIALKVLEANKFEGKRMIVSAGFTPYADFFRRIADEQKISRPRITAGPLLTSIAWRFAALYAFITGKKPLLTRQSAASASRKIIFRGNYLQEAFPDFSFRSLEETLQWILLKNG